MTVFELITKLMEYPGNRVVRIQKLKGERVVLDAPVETVCDPEVNDEECVLWIPDEPADEIDSDSPKVLP